MKTVYRGTVYRGTVSAEAVGVNSARVAGIGSLIRPFTHAARPPDRQRRQPPATAYPGTDGHRTVSTTDSSSAHQE